MVCMANTFTLYLTILTVFTGFIWILDYLPFSKNQYTVYQTDSWKKILIKKIVQKIITTSSIFPVLLSVFILRSFIFEPFQIPSASMMPTLLVGDFILVNKFAYGIKDPITHTTLIKTGLPKRGDVVVFKYPLEPHIDYIKRVIGLPGDHIFYNYITNNITVQPSNASDKMIIPSSYYHQTMKNRLQESNSDYSLYKREFASDSNKNILSLLFIDRTFYNRNSFSNFACYKYYNEPYLIEWIVPKGKYFMMGDNFNNSADSRHWGFVPEKNLVGKAFLIWMSLEKKEGKWPTGLRLNRINIIY
ncbi:signal peptidase I [Candidatus Schneideria nysicola]|uniref:signal peptidase I n=1 Tax=Candidatus Schneideria nysicola TaxID=1081631 RepID=UPI003B968638